MKTIGSHPGAILFRMSIMVILIAITVVVFFTYIGDLQRNTERTAITRTKNILQSSIAVVFATYAVQSRLDELNDLDGANPFEFLRDYSLLPTTYLGEIEHELNDGMSPGWYYLVHRRRIEYKSSYLPDRFRFELVLDYRDINESGRFEPSDDQFKGLFLRRIETQN